ncbi:xanthine dehydrogenase molybdopterin binding subunit [Devosia sp. XJ19-1]|uniref:Xanthine dehydrogenase molybdopterin binding subunit n=1 Tax=Devosia ureilytica TaxID=2952754 RepID=A0A9Q4APQ8_9HYPH|nr:xanthine dehydrogenase molybdopterin binding subunit [Devosia ureilytica]MCP8883957.1 xanthine dehydrogenase molybdopterin binding subunit [Devosia ureilytica]MCP8887565.1 xanthine dehydrogenase molybdopterin binding subunit [Devosia ureilytica]
MNKQTDISLATLHAPTRHDSGPKHVTGTAEYIDDMVEPVGTMHAYLGLSTKPHAEIISIDLDAVRAAPGVIGVLTAEDIPGENDVSPSHKHDEPIFAEGRVQFWGQPMFAVIAETRDAARRAAHLVKVEYHDLPHIPDVRAAQAAGGKLVTEPLKLERGDVETGLAAAPRRAKGAITIGGQDHFYLEGQIAFAVPGEDEDVTVYSSTQHPSEVQLMVAQVLAIRHNAVTVTVRRMGGGFGGKETQGNLFAAVAALAAKKWNRACKIRPDRDDDMSATGKRHDFVVDYDVGYDDTGKILAVDAVYGTRGGFSSDLTGPVSDRALFHCDNAYWYPAVRARSEPLYTNTVSNTAFRGFGGPQGMIAAERWVEDIAYALGKDPLDIRKANFYGTDTDNVTPYHQTVEDNIVHRVVEELEASSDYQARRQAVLDFNRSNNVLKKGIALTPVKFGISFTATWYNQAGALVHVYKDGSIHLSHGGTEMGQGLYIKVAQVVADAFGVNLDSIKIMATSTGKVPNTSATAASSGSDLNGMAAYNACAQIKARLTVHAAQLYQCDEAAVEWVEGGIKAGDTFVTFAELAASAYLNRVQLSAAGFYKTPKIHWDRATGRGHPFYYFAYGASVSEVTVDTLTGEYVVDRVDILHDVGKSLNPAVDIGQIEGGFIQGMGWLTTEELVWDDKGQLRTHAPSTYKIPLASDVPPIFNVQLAEWSENREPTIGRSKAVGEPPFMLAMSVVEALGMAVASVGDYKLAPQLDTPVTPERVLMGVERMKRARGS